MTNGQRKIMEAWSDAEEEFPERSTEFIMAIVCDRMHCDQFDLIGALQADYDSKQEETE